MTQTDPSGRPRTCPRCHQPVNAGTKFCESCGAKLEPLVSCPHCGDPLTPGVKFCESCGRPVTPATAAPGVVAPGESTPAHVQEPPVTAETPRDSSPAVPSAAGPAESPSPVVTEPVVMATSGEPASHPPPPGPAVETGPAAPEPAIPQKAAAAGGKNTLIIAGIIGLLVIAALAYVVVLPMLAASSASEEKTVSPSTPVPQYAGDAKNTGGTSNPVTQSAASGSFKPLPTQILPANIEVVYQVERDPRNGIVLVTFTGGPGLNGISSTLIRVTRSDGQVMEKSWKPTRIGDSTTVQGTVMTDRVEVITNFYNGESYRCYDQIFEYHQRN